VAKVLLDLGEILESKKYLIHALDVAKKCESAE
jgi:hypothetical protein